VAVSDANELMPDDAVPCSDMDPAALQPLDGDLELVDPSQDEFQHDMPLGGLREQGG